MGSVSGFSSTFLMLKKRYTNGRFFDVYCLLILALSVLCVGCKENSTNQDVKVLIKLQKSVDAGDVNAQVILGDMYYKGDGVPKDYAKALDLFQKAAAQGNAGAQNNIGAMYYNGEGVPKDYAKALDWYQKAAAQGNATAQENLGRMYDVGEGTTSDHVLAYAWLNLAAAQGDEAPKGTIEYRDGLRLTPAERTEAQRLSSNWTIGKLLFREDVSGNETVSSGGQLVKRGSGTAFFVNKTGQAITNYHVIDGCKEIRAEGHDGVVKVVTTDAINDIALIHITGSVSATATINNSPAKLRQGEDIVVFGFPLQQVLSSRGNLTPGVVSALTGLGNNTNQIQITAPIQPGSSGSPVLNKKGEIVGIVSMKVSDTKMARATGQIAQTVNFAVSGQTLKTFLDTHKVDYHTRWFFIGSKSAADLADEARKWTLVVECWN